MSPEISQSVMQGDCGSVLKAMADGSFELIYVDPPFFSQKKHALGTRDRRRVFTFADLWSSGAAYAEFLYERMVELQRLLTATGSLFFHCDSNASHFVRAILDDVFGADQFRSEIIWHYRRWSNSARGLLPAHQTIYYYTKSDSFTFNPILVDYSPSTNVDQILQRRGRDEFNKSVYDRDEEGNVIPHGKKKGVPLGDVWDIPFLNPKAKERVGYPTQKPILLLERIISLATNPADRVLDPFCGSGTTLIAAHLLGRSAVGIDISTEAVELTRSRLAEPIKTESLLLNRGRDAYRNSDEELLAMLHGLEVTPVQRNAGMDALLKTDFEGRPVTIRFQRPGEPLEAAACKLYRASTSKGAKLMFLVACSRSSGFEFAQELPPGVVVIESPALNIREKLAAAYQQSPLS